MGIFNSDFKAKYGSVQENTVTESVQEETKEYHPTMTTFTVGDDPEWIAAKYCAQIQEGVNAFVRELGKDELNFVTENRDLLLSDPSFLAAFNEADEEEKKDDNKEEKKDDSSKSGGYDVNKDRVNKIKRNIKRVIQHLIEKIREAVDKLVQRLMKAISKNKDLNGAKQIIAKIKSIRKPDEIEKAAIQKLTGMRFSVNMDIVKTGFILNSSDTLNAFKKFLDGYGDSIDYAGEADKRAANNDNKGSQKFSDKSAKTYRKSVDELDKYNRKMMSKLSAVAPVLSSDRDADGEVNLLKDPVYNLENITEFLLICGANTERVKQMQASLDTKFTNLIIQKSVEIEKHSNESVAAQFVDSASEIAQSYITLVGNATNAIASFYQQCYLLFTRFCTDLKVNPATGIPYGTVDAEAEEKDDDKK